MPETKTAILSEATRQQIDEWLQKYPPNHKRSAVLWALRIVQEENGGWLTNELMNAVADYLEMPHIAVYEVATFYSMYDLEPVGRHKILFCTNISCMLAGCDRIAEHVKQRLNINFGETTLDGRFTLKEVECMAACGAPMMQIDRDYHVNLTPEKVDEILDKYQ
jgi:NADH-quinone oxidoreductase subunit E